MSDSATPQKPEKPVLPPFPEADLQGLVDDIAKINKLIGYIGEVQEYLKDVGVYIESQGQAKAVTKAKSDALERDGSPSSLSSSSPSLPSPPRPRSGFVPISYPTAGGGKKKQRKTKKKGGADIDYSKVYNVQGLIENISKSTGKDPITSQSIPAPFSTGSPLQRLGKKEAKSLPNELKNEIIPDYSQDGGKKKKTEKKKMPKKK